MLKLNLKHDEKNLTVILTFKWHGLINSLIMLEAYDWKTPELILELSIDV